MKYAFNKYESEFELELKDTCWDDILPCGRYYYNILTDEVAVVNNDIVQVLTRLQFLKHMDIYYRYEHGVEYGEEEFSGEVSSSDI